MEFRHGVRRGPARRSIGATDRRGTEVHFMAATETFGRIEYHYEILARRIRELSFLNNGVKIELVDQRDGKSENFAYSGGIKGFVEYMNRSKSVLHPKVFHAVGEKDGHDRRSGDAVERLVRRERPVLHQQYSAARRRHAPDRPAAGDDAHAQQLHREGRDRQEGQGRDHRRRHARRPELRAVGEGAGAQVLVADQGQARVLGSDADRAGESYRPSSPISCSRTRTTRRSSAARSSTQRGRARPRARRGS